MSTPTDDYEAMASEWIRDPKNWDMISRINDEGTEGMISTLAAFARSVAHPPTSELVSAGNAMKGELERFIDLHEFKHAHATIAIDAWDAALAHPKEVAPTVDQMARWAFDWFEGPVDNGPGSDLDKLRAHLQKRITK